MQHACRSPEAAWLLHHAGDKPPGRAPRAESFTGVCKFDQPARAQTTVEGTLNGAPFLETLSPDGQGSHWLKVSRTLRTAAGATAGETVTLEMRPSKVVPEPNVPVDLRKALTASPDAKSVWQDITPKARADWILWITTAKQAETRTRRIANAMDMLATGKRRVCCFDRSGIYGGNFSAPEACANV
jgi:hypothetical protein